jgi:diaminohydroxyphosphoribosylaminopyrimidine deaminase / 5-amino-6-(5-phosphoribosylamino)uracil reductase
MRRCLELAREGAGHVAPNPMVGAVLVQNNLVIGEGWHRQYGKAHAEVNCILDAIKRLSSGTQHENSHGSPILPATLDRNDLVLYVSLEPCSHFGKTPPCTELIINNRIPKVVIGCRDPFPTVNGTGVNKLRMAGIEVTENVVEEDCRDINRRFFTFQLQHRPYIILKWAETSDGFMASEPLHNEDTRVAVPRLLISNEFTNRMVHKWRSEEAAILVGTNTAISDDPELTTRHWRGKSPVRLVIDMDLKLPPTLKIFNNKSRTIIFNEHRHGDEGNTSYYQVGRDASIVQQILNGLYQLNIQSVLVEGGARLLQSFIDEDVWDEARIIRSKTVGGKGLAAPELVTGYKMKEESLDSDLVSYYKR